MVWQPTRRTRAELEERALAAGRLLGAKRSSRAEMARARRQPRGGDWNARGRAAGAAGGLHALPGAVRLRRADRGGQLLGEPG